MDRFEVLEHSPWKPGFWSRAPWFGLLSLLGAFICTVGAAVVLATSNGAEHQTWPNRDIAVQPSVVLSVLTAATNALLVLAFGEGVTIAWWTKMLRGGSLNDCHRYWFYANSIWAAITSGRHFNRVALAYILVALVVIDGPILQRSSTITSLVINRPGNFSVAVTDDLIGIPTGYYMGRSKSIDTLSSNFTNILRAYNNRDPIRVRSEGCRGVCRGEIIAPGFDVDCKYGTEKALEMPDPGDQVGAGNISVSFMGPWDPGAINVSTRFAPEGILKSMVTSTCRLQIGLVRHSVELTNGSLSLHRQPIPLGNGAINRTVETWWPWIETSGNGKFPTSIGGIAKAAGSLYDSEISLYDIGGSLQMFSEGTMGYTYRNSTDGVLGDAAMSWTDPTADVIATLQELTFRFAVYNTNDTTPLVKGANDGEAKPRRLRVRRQEGGGATAEENGGGGGGGSETVTINIYASHFGYLGAALAVMLVATMAVFPLFYGWWNLGRDVSMSPVEIAKAFKAPHTEGADANASVDKLLRQIGKRKARYGVVATTEFEGADSSRLNLTLGGGRMGSTTTLASPLSPNHNLAVHDPDSKRGYADDRAMSPSLPRTPLDVPASPVTPRSPFAIGDPRTLSWPIKKS